MLKQKKTGQKSISETQIVKNSAHQMTRFIFKNKLRRKTKERDLRIY